MSDARDRLEMWASGLVPSNVVSRRAAEQALDAFLARPNDLLAVLVEAGVLVPAGYSHARPTGMAPYVVHWEPVEGTSNAQVYRRTDQPTPA